MKLLWFFLCLFSSVLADEPVKHNDDSVESFLANFTSAESESFLSFFKGLVQVGYEENKLSAIAQIVQKLREDKDSSNVTLIGYQNIYDKDGNIKEIRTVELFIPGEETFSSNLHLSADRDDNSFDITELDKLREARDIIQAISYFGIEMELFYKEKADDGKDDYNTVLIDKNLLAMKYDHVFYANVSITVDTIEEVNNKYQKEHSKYGTGPVSYLAFNKDKKFIPEKSTVAPELFASISSDYDQPDPEILKTSLSSLVTSFLESSDRSEVPENFRKSFTSHYPDLTFIVVEGDPSGSYTYRDFSIHLTYDYLYLEDDIEYTVYGYNSSSS